MKDDDKVTLARLTVIAGLMLAVSIIVGLLLGRARAGPAVEKVIPDSAWATTPECQALKRSTGGTNIPIPDRCDLTLADDGDSADVHQMERDFVAKPTRFQPWQQIWQCNDIRVTVTERQAGVIEYDLGGTIWGGSRFTKPFTGPLYFNDRQCLYIAGWPR